MSLKIETGVSLLGRFLATSLMYIKKNKGPKIDPCVICPLFARDDNFQHQILKEWGVTKNECQRRLQVFLQQILFALIYVDIGQF